MSDNHRQNEMESVAPKDTDNAATGDDTVSARRGPAAPRSHHAVAVAAFVVSLIALAGSGFVWYSTAVTGRLALTETLTRAEVIAQEFDELRSSQRTAETQQNVLRRQIEDDRRTLEDELKGLNETTRTEFSRLDEQQKTVERELKAEFDMLVQSIESTRQEMFRGTDEWLLEEISQLLSLANERLLLIGDVRSALKALELAQERMAELADPTLLGVRRQLAADTAVLTTIPVPDIDGIVLQLSILIQQVSDLRLAGEAVVAGFTDTAEQTSKPSAADNTLKELGRRLIEDLSDLVRIRNIETTQAPNLASDQRFLVYESVRWPLNAAQLALLRGLPSVYRNSLDRALGALTRGFDEASTEVVVFRSVIQELAAVELTNEYPDLSKTLGLLRGIIHRRSGSE
jgi:uroporphyrin-3 C-methyltransferase